MRTICEITTTAHSPFLWFFIIEILVGILVVYLIRHFGKALLHTGGKDFLWPLGIFMSVVFFFVMSGITIIVFLLLLFQDDHPPSLNYHVLNAAIKNTCFLDPQKNHCPKSVDDLISIEPERFKELTKNANLTYQYYPETNQYTLIVRNNNFWENNNRVAIFDPRLTAVKNYGNRVDFLDSEIMVCGGKYSIKNPPPFKGPWDNIN